MGTTAIFLDTNFFYDFCDVDQIKWIEDCKVERVKLLVAHAVIREMNVHKDLGHARLGDRARATLSRIGSRFAGKTTASVRDGATLHFETDAVPFPKEFSTHLGDDHLLASLLKYCESHPEETVWLATRDVGLTLKAGLYGVTTYAVPDKYETKAAEDEKDKRIRQLSEHIAKQDQLIARHEKMLELTIPSLEPILTFRGNPQLDIKRIALIVSIHNTGSVVVRNPAVEMRLLRPLEMDPPTNHYVTPDAGSWSESDARGAWNHTLVHPLGNEINSYPHTVLRVTTVRLNQDPLDRPVVGEFRVIADRFPGRWMGFEKRFNDFAEPQGGILLTEIR